MGSFNVVGPHAKYTTVAVDSTASFSKGDIVIVSSGQVTGNAGGDTQGITLALQDFPDSEYEGTQSAVEVVMLGNDCELKHEFTGYTAAAAWVGSKFVVAAGAGAQTIDLSAATTAGVFTVTRFDEGTASGDTTGFVVGVFDDAATFGGS